jgi:hypothetical protein
MPLLLYAGHFLISSGWLRLISTKGTLYLLVAVLATLVTVRNRSQIIPGILMLAFLTDCDPWNG